ncbi:MAG: DUF262 domain-containing protein [Lentihominibacter sp.]
MADYSHEKLKDLLKQIDEGRVILPAMQRNFVWPEDKICHLFDSIMHDYPIGTFLFWKIEKRVFDEYTFNTFIKQYDEGKGKMQRGKKATADFTDYLAVLDGQQRITSLYLGIKGKYRTHIKGKKWDDPSSFFDRVLCIDIFYAPNEEGDEYNFAFVDEKKVESLLVEENGALKYWVPVSKVADEMDCSEYTDAIEELYDEVDSVARKSSRKILEKLVKAMDIDVNFYEAKDKTLPEVVDIFVRVNSGGQKLNSSDLMLSVAAGEQGDVDIHVKMQEAIDEINAAPIDEENGFKVDKELLLTAGLMLTGAENLSLQKQENYSSKRMNDIFKDHWDQIVDAMKSTVTYIEYLGFNGKRLNGRNLVLPIAFYFYKNNLSDLHKKTSERAECDRVFIRQWLLRTIVNNVFVDGTGSTLLQMRNLIDKSDKKHFPLEELMEAGIKKPLSISDEQIDAILDLRYGDSKIVPIFNELCHEAHNANQQVDHIWPKALLTSKRALKKAYPTISDEEIRIFKERCNSLANLQLLDSLDNQQKSDREFDEWIETRFANNNAKTTYTVTHFIPEGISYSFKNFVEFFDRRELILRNAIADAFPSDFNEIVKKYGLQAKI